MGPENDVTEVIEAEFARFCDLDFGSTSVGVPLGGFFVSKDLLKAISKVLLHYFVSCLFIISHQRNLIIG